MLLLSDGLANVGVTDRDEIAERAGRWRERGIRISTMGMGVDYDEDLMMAIAQRAQGNYSYVDHAESIGAHLDRELDQLCRVVARDLWVEVGLGDGFELREVYGYSSERRSGRLSIRVPDMAAGESRKILLRLGISRRGSTRVRLVTSTLRYVDTAANEERHHAAPHAVSRSTLDPDRIDNGRDLGVLAKVEVVKNAVALEIAMDNQRDGELDLARELLRERVAASRTVNEAYCRSAEVARLIARMEHVAAELERTWDDPWARRDLQLKTQLSALGYTTQ